MRISADCSRGWKFSPSVDVWLRPQLGWNFCFFLIHFLIKPHKLWKSLHLLVTLNGKQLRASWTKNKQTPKWQCNSKLKCSFLSGHFVGPKKHRLCPAIRVDIVLIIHMASVGPWFTSLFWIFTNMPFLGPRVLNDFNWRGSWVETACVSYSLGKTNTGRGWRGGWGGGKRFLFNNPSPPRSRRRSQGRRRGTDEPEPSSSPAGPPSSPHSCGVRPRMAGTRRDVERLWPREWI